MQLVEALLLGALQGLTEFLPVSSSGHLLLGQYFLGMDQDAFGLSFDVALHMGTLLAVVSFFWRDLTRLTAALLRSLPRPDFADREQRLAYLVALATIPAAGLGFFMRDFFERGLRSPWVVVAGLVVFGVLFIASERVGRKDRKIADLTYAESLVIGVGQAISLVPGVSRSGATITFGMFLGLRREEAARFSFLMSIPITAGAGMGQLPYLAEEGLGLHSAGLFLAGALSSGVVGYLSIKYLLLYLSRHSMRIFAYYGFALSALIVALLLLGL